VSKPATMRIVYTGDGSQMLPDLQVVVEPGKPVTIPEAVATELLARDGWAKASTPKGA